jgi:hypothetical protein
MSGFLARLAEKALSVAPVIKPRPVSIFEPVTQGYGMSSPDTAEPVAAHTIRTPGASEMPMPAKPPALVEPQAATTGAAEIKREPNIVQNLVAVPKNDPAGFDHPANATHTAERVERVERDRVERVVTTERLAGIPPPAAAEPFPAPPEKTITERIIRELVPAGPPRVPAGAQTARPESGSRIKSEAAQTAQLLSPRKGLLPQVPIIPLPAAPPEVRISIGRIEVRHAGTQPAEPAECARSTGPQLALEDYLKKRNGAGR